MTSKLKCPVCKKPLEQVGTSRQYQCGSWSCDLSFNMIGTEALWVALIQAKQDLKIATKANDEIRGEYETYHGAERERCFTINWEVVAKKMYNYANKALEQITHDNSEKANSVEHKE